MSVRGTLGGILAATAVLVIGWQVGATASSGGATARASGGTGTLKDGAFTGTSEDTRFGPVQVRVTVSGGKVTEATALQLTDDGPRSVEISNRAAPVLREEVLAAQSAQVSYVSGATYTSDAYLRSVQSALDQAKA